MGVAGLSRLWLKYAVKGVKIKNYDTFKKLIWGDRPGGLLTVSNHISTVDDPLIWGALLDSREVCELVRLGQMRWTVGARELTFTNPLTSWFFERGQVIPIVRGEGIYQPAMDQAIDILNSSNKWLHFFPEGRVIQYQKKIERLKWGVGRLIMESRRDLAVLPMILKGFDLMKPNDHMPVLDHEVEIVIGEPVQSDVLLKATEHIRNEDERRSAITKCIQDILNGTK